MTSTKNAATLTQVLINISSWRNHDTCMIFCTGDLLCRVPGFQDLLVLFRIFVVVFYWILLLFCFLIRCIFCNFFIFVPCNSDGYPRIVQVIRVIWVIDSLRFGRFGWFRWFRCFGWFFQVSFNLNYIKVKTMKFLKDSNWIKICDGILFDGHRKLFLCNNMALLQYNTRQLNTWK